MAWFEGRYLTGNPTDKRYDSAGTAEFFRSLFTSGVMALGDNLRVEGRGGGTILVHPGSALLDGYLVKVIADTADPFLMALPAGEAIHRVVLRAERNGPKIYHKAGTAGTAPALERADGVYEMSLAQVKVTGEGRMTIKDERGDSQLCGVCKLLPDKMPHQSLVDLIYPVGSYYIAHHNTSPAALFGGSWLRVQERFLWACAASESIGATGGEKEHTLTVDEMPSHRHDVQYAGTSVSGYGFVDSGQARSSNMQRTSFTGGGRAHNNMPPYLNVAVWRRTA